MLKTPSKNTPVYVEHLFSSTTDFPKELQKIDIRDQDIIYTLEFGKDGLQTLQAKDSHGTVAKIFSNDSKSIQNLIPRSAYQERYQGNVYIDLHTDSNYLVDSILIFIQDTDKTVKNALSFDLLQQRFGLWTDDRWTEFQLTKNGLQYVHFVASKEDREKLSDHDALEPFNKTSVIIDGQPVAPIYANKTKPMISTPQKNNTPAQMNQFLAIVAQLSQPTQNILLTKWMMEARQALASHQ